MSNPVEKGKAFEEEVVEYLNDKRFKAIRTNVTNEYDPSTYKHGFDGGVDIIASYAPEEFNIGYTFYIQCKCHKRCVFMRVKKVSADDVKLYDST